MQRKKGSRLKWLKCGPLGLQAAGPLGRRGWAADLLLAKTSFITAFKVAVTRSIERASQGNLTCSSFHKIKTKNPPTHLSSFKIFTQLLSKISLSVWWEETETFRKHFFKPFTADHKKSRSLAFGPSGLWSSPRSERLSCVLRQYTYLSQCLSSPRFENM